MPARVAFVHEDALGCEHGDLKAFELSMLDDDPSEMLPSLVDLMTDQVKTLDEDIIIKKKIATIIRGIKTTFQVGSRVQK